MKKKFLKEFKNQKIKIGVHVVKPNQKELKIAISKGYDL